MAPAFRKPVSRVQTGAARPERHITDRPADKYFGTVADFDGTSDYAETASPVVDTTGSYSVSAWVNMSSMPTRNATIVSQQGNVNASFCLQFNNGFDGTQRWNFPIPTADATSQACAPWPGTDQPDRLSLFGATGSRRCRLIRGSCGTRGR
ncbi:MAG TPA: LamG-like jellyroll fold domain-containing protein [Streptosporangiaceae bacterium]|nr:LamG-like jellyroll fold domain-containing protein [Streptosporangiaceae bacterium]